jgi:aryl-alcohol dehydrogenase-like predicted oxidoreductase
MPKRNSQTPTPGGTARLGQSTVARIGFGVMQLERRAPNRAAALAILTAAADAGIDHFDTAAFYENCNELIRAALNARRDDIVLATKVGAARNPAGDLVPGQKPKELRRQIKDNLDSLGTDHLDVVNLRRLDHAPGIRAEGDQIVDIDLQLAELVALRDAGTIGAIGLSNVSAQQLEHALPAGIACVQNLYNLLERDTAPVLDAWPPERCRMGAVLPAGVRLPRPKEGHRRSNRAGRRHRAQSDRRAGRSRVAACRIRGHPADHRHLRPRAPGRKHRRRRSAPPDRGARRAQPRRVTLIPAARPTQTQFTPRSAVSPAQTAPCAPRNPGKAASFPRSSCLSQSRSRRRPTTLPVHAHCSRPPSPPRVAASAAKRGPADRAEVAESGPVLAATPGWENGMFTPAPA